MELIFLMPLFIFLVMASLMIGCFCYQKKRYENMQYVIYRVNPDQADTSRLPVIQGATDMYVIGLHRPGQANLQMCNLNNPAVNGLMANLRNGPPGITPFTPVPAPQHTYNYTPVPAPQHTYNYTPPPPTYPESQHK